MTVEKLSDGRLAEQIVVGMRGRPFSTSTSDGVPARRMPISEFDVPKSRPQALGAESWLMARDAHCHGRVTAAATATARPTVPLNNS
jgi:hypothetical protein